MKPQETKFILRAHRADGRYRTGDPLFADALAEAGRDPALAAWLSREHALDTTIANKLDGIQPPTGLREAILVGARASRLSRRWWHNPVWFAAAAGLMLVLAISSTFLRPDSPPAPPATLAEFGLDRLAFGPHTHNPTDGAVALEKELAATTGPLPAVLVLDVADLDRRGCEEFTFGGRRVYEVCFQRNGTWFHLYVTTRDSASPHDAGPKPEVIERNGYVAATWSTEEAVYALATKASIEALNRAL